MLERYTLNEIAGSSRPFIMVTAIYQLLCSSSLPTRGGVFSDMGFDRGTARFIRQKSSRKIRHVAIRRVVASFDLYVFC